jgi:Leucine-rich repeat (LRR) protein
VTCVYSTHATNLGPLSRPYQCTASEQPVRGLVAVDHVVGGHAAGKTSDDVKVLNVKSIKSDRIPVGFEKHFRNVEGVFAFSSDKTELLKADLAGFPKLRYLDISWNRIVNLPSDVFEDNLQLEWIDLSDNRLKLVGLDLLNYNTKLHYANFGNNRCIDELARDKTDIERTLKKNLVRNCQPFGESYTGTTFSPNRQIPSVTPSYEDVTTTTAKGFFKKFFG